MQLSRDRAQSNTQHIHGMGFPKSGETVKRNAMLASMQLQRSLPYRACSKPRYSNDTVHHTLAKLVSNVRLRALNTNGRSCHPTQSCTSMALLGHLYEGLARVIPTLRQLQ